MSTRVSPQPDVSPCKCYLYSTADQRTRNEEDRHGPADLCGGAAVLHGRAGARGEAGAAAQLLGEAPHRPEALLHLHDRLDLALRLPGMK